MEIDMDVTLLNIIDNDDIIIDEIVIVSLNN